MRSTCRLPLNSCIVSVFAVALAVMTASAGPLAGSAPSLLAATDNPIVDELQTAIRSRGVEIDAVALDALATGRPIELNLFNDLTFVASLRKTGRSTAICGPQQPHR